MRESVLYHKAVIREAVAALENSPKAIVAIVSENDVLLGTITDGDVRRALLAGQNLDNSVQTAMNRSPVVGEHGMSKGYLLELLTKNNLEAIPIIDNSGKLVDIQYWTDLASVSPASETADFSCAVIMVGGEGRRLRPLTEKMPKPMIDIGGSPLLERSVRSLEQVGIKKLYLATNYLSEAIENYFGDGNRFGVEIKYLREDKKLGTAGALSLLKNRPKDAFLVINGDIMTGSDYRNISIFHREHGSLLTVGAVGYHVDIPYGVIKNNGTRAVALQEKPSQRFLCSAGIYAVSPDALEYIPNQKYFDMTDLVSDCINTEQGVTIFPIHEYWTDIGTPEDLEKAREHVQIRKNPYIEESCHVE